MDRRFGGLLTNDTRSRPRHCREPLHANILFAIEADPERARIHSAERGSHFTQLFGAAIKTANGQIALLGVLNRPSLSLATM